MAIFPVDGESISLAPRNSMVTPRNIVKLGCWVSEENIRLSPNLVADITQKIIRLRIQNSRIGTAIVGGRSLNINITEMSPKSSL
jgi:hypothetical protein